ncbi:MAG: hypothetical protein M3020_20515 [Myxococcota bacterium]|nr:hypothetical protein [Myxococcota bacterium]
MADVYLDACCFIYLVEGQPAWRTAVESKVALWSFGPGRAGHEDLQTTLGYMHLAKGETERAIRMLDARQPDGSRAGRGSEHRGSIQETG